MEGFKNANFATENKLDRFTGKIVRSPVSPREENLRMVQAGFTIDKENGIYVMEGFGAFKHNVDKEITSIDDLREYYDEILKSNPYDEVIRLMDEEGYDFVLGPGAPAKNGVVYGPGLYCRNYKEIIEKQKAAKLQKEQEQSGR